MIHLVRLFQFLSLFLTIFAGLPGVPRYDSTLRRNLTAVQHETESFKIDRDKIKYAICLTGQLLRLELGSKLKHIVEANLNKDLFLSLYLVLDSEVKEHKAVKNKNRYRLEDAIYANHSTQSLYQVIKDFIPHSSFTIHVRLEPPTQKTFLVRPEGSPVSAQNLTGIEEKDRAYAYERFQNHMRWQNGLRECIKWVQAVEVAHKFHYDFVMRIREDTFVLENFFFFSGTKGKLISQGIHSFGGVNDHNMVVDRAFADDLFRGLTEDYYLNINSHGIYWRNPEMLLRRMANYYGIPRIEKNLCLFPFLAIKYRENSTHWNIAATYRREELQIYQNMYKKHCWGKYKGSANFGHVRLMEPDI